MPETNEAFEPQNCISPVPADPANLDVARTGPLSEATLLGRKTHPVAADVAQTTGALPRSEYRTMAGLLGGYALLIMGNGLFQTLIPLRMLNAGDTTFAVGMIQSCYYVGFMVGAIFNRRLIDRIGQHRTFVAFSAVVAILALAFGRFESTWALALIRFLTGFAFMGLYTSIESWLNGVVRNERRGQVFGSYAAINYLAVGSGQFLLNAGDSSGNTQLSIVAALFTAAILPVTLLEGWPLRVSDAALDRMPSQTWKESILALKSSTPLAIPGCVLAGFLYSTFYSMTPVYLARTGFSTAELSAFMGTALIGALLPQWPMGRLSDIIDRRRLVCRIALVSTCLSAALVVFHQRHFVWVATLVYVAVTFTQYGLIVSHVNDRTEPHRRVAVTATLLLMFSFGGMVGPFVASLLMSAIGPGGLFVFNGISCAMLALCAAHAMGKTQPA
ncbi:MFS transporter [Paraburkholderia sartisoli]|uniref:Sugar phosphate permease n=1 Tax=Paraburkholderia sartisoli TaxID=83784 RepID=A0A1H4HDC1_9BURK|nr:MFS transporter [Paraburkholderia sartisoli]SEB19666.1 Sugar phosphate permease [Paraburkholderia sartisoli]